MTSYEDEMRRALEAGGEKLRALTGEDHGPFFPDLECECIPGRPICERCAAQEDRADG